MSMRLEMLQVARLAPKLLGESCDLVTKFLERHKHESGGFIDRTGAPDLYYTVFGIESLVALQAAWNHYELQRFLNTFGAGEKIDFIHRCCLARCWASIDGSKSGLLQETLPSLLEANRTADGGYNQLPHQEYGTVYGAFLGVGAYQDLGLPVPNVEGLVRSLRRLETRDGGWANDPLTKQGTSPATAAAMTLLRNLNQPVPTAAAEWLKQQAHPQGGFRAAPMAPIPDLLSTATSLHALAGVQMEIQDLRESCLDYIDSLWTNQGSFHGHWSDEILDCEYTYYGLLALGHLAV